MTWEGLDSSRRGGKLGRQMPERVPSEDRQLQSEPSQQIGGHSILVMSRLPSLGERTWRRLREVPGEQSTMGRRDAPPGDGRLAGWKNRWSHHCLVIACWDGIL